MYASAALQSALSNLRNSISELEMVLNEIRAPSATDSRYIFSSRVERVEKYRKPRAASATTWQRGASWQNACELGFRGKPRGVGTPNGGPCEAVNGGWLHRKG